MLFVFLKSHIVKMKLRESMRNYIPEKWAPDAVGKRWWLFYILGMITTIASLLFLCGIASNYGSPYLYTDVGKFDLATGCTSTGSALCIDLIPSPPFYRSRAILGDGTVAVGVLGTAAESTWFDVTRLPEYHCPQ